MTNALGNNTENFPVNWIKEEGRIWGRVAFLRGKSKNATVKDYAHEGLKKEFPLEAAQIQEIREKRQRMLAVSQVILVLWISFATTVQFRRSSVTQVRRGRVEEVA